MPVNTPPSVRMPPKHHFGRRPHGFALATGIVLAAFVGACDGDDDEVSRCGPTKAVVARIIDGDTVELDTGETVRYLMIDTPESTNGADDCWGQDAKLANAEFVEGKEVRLEYDVECTDIYGRLLAYVSVGDRVINELMVERGHACVLHIPPNGEDVIDTYLSLESTARAAGRGVWGACDPVTCE